MANAKDNYVFSQFFDGGAGSEMRSVPSSPGKFFLKRLLDIFTSVILIIFFFPLWVIIPLLIKLDSPGSVFFSQERAGKDGRLFTMLKFRSMIADAEKLREQLRPLNEASGPVFKIRDDPRITRIGKLLRVTSLDELPQLFNVLKGDMSMVGPRPLLLEEITNYHQWRKRQSVVPGLTCFWQINGRHELQFSQWMELDLQYIENWSLALDFKILLRTIPAVFSSRGAR